MSRRSAPLGSGATRRIARVAVPVLVGLAALLAGLQYPGSSVPGGVMAGPRGLAHLRPVVLDFHPSIGWGPHRRDVVLTLRPRRPCTVRVDSVTSTAPGRIEVHATESGSRCTGPRRIQHVTLALPQLPDPRRNVLVEIGPESLRLHWARTPPHPPGTLDV